MLILGLIRLVIGFIAKIAILWTIGIILLSVGAVLWILGSMGRLVGGRRHYWERAGAPPVDPMTVRQRHRVCARSPPQEPARTSGARC